MIKKIKYCLLLFIVFFSFIVKVDAVTVPSLFVSDKYYSRGEKLNLEELDKVYTATRGEKVQLYAFLAFGNEMLTPGSDGSERGWFVEQVNLEGVSWSSSNTKVATVDSKGLVTTNLTGSAQYMREIVIVLI